MWIDYTQLLHRLDNDHDTAQEMLALFLTEYQRLLSELQHAVSAGLPVCKLGHSIKGMCRDMGADQLSQWAAALEHGTGNPANITQQMVDTLPDVQKAINSHIS
jgi:HPt (histidine-containing phosphotransfer) domain-containing protein